MVVGNAVLSPGQGSQLGPLYLSHQPPLISSNRPCCPGDPQACAEGAGDSYTGPCGLVFALCKCCFPCWGSLPLSMSWGSHSLQGFWLNVTYSESFPGSLFK